MALDTIHIHTSTSSSLKEPSWEICYIYVPQMNQVQSELRLARSVIAERDSEIQHVRTTNNQVS